MLTDYDKNFSEIKREDVEEIAKKIKKMGSKQVLIKSFEENNKLNTFYLSEKTSKWFEKDKIEVKISGTGDAFSSLVTSELLKDENLEKSIDKIQDLLYENIKNQEKFESLNEIKLENFKIGL